MGLGLSPSRRACEAGFDVFVEMKSIFSTTPEAENFSKSKEKEVREEMEAKGGH
jgi:hypothetical protein